MKLDGVKLMIGQHMVHGSFLYDVDIQFIRIIGGIRI